MQKASVDQSGTRLVAAQFAAIVFRHCYQSILQRHARQIERRPIRINAAVSDDQPIGVDLGRQIENALYQRVVLLK